MSVATFGKLLVSAFGGYVGGFLAGMAVVTALSSNRHDKSMEAAMTAAFVFGPLGAVLEVVAAWVWWVP